MGKLRLGTKSDIVSCLENLIDIDEVSNPKVDAVILDGAAIVTLYLALLDVERRLCGIHGTYLMRSPQHFVPWQLIQIQTPYVNNFNYWSALWW